jgi:hypothetical protein
LKILTEQKNLHRSIWTWPPSYSANQEITPICADYLVELRGFEPMASAVRLQCSPNRLTFERPSNLALCSGAGQTSKARSGGHHFDLRPGAKDSDSLGQEAVAMDLRRRSKNRVVEAMARIIALLPIG